MPFRKATLSWHQLSHILLPVTEHLGHCVAGRPQASATGGPKLGGGGLRFSMFGKDISNRKGPAEAAKVGLLMELDDCLSLPLRSLKHLLRP